MVNNETGFANGHGIFLTGEWIHCGAVEKDTFKMGSKVSANKKTGELRLLSWRQLDDGTLLEKIERYTDAGVESGFYRNSVKLSELSQRLNFAR